MNEVYWKELIQTIQGQKWHMVSGLMPEPVGRYQISISSHKNTGVYETTIDTRTGEIFKREKVKYNQYDKID